MADIRITDLVDSQVFADLEKLSADIKSLKEQYVDAARELANGLNMKISTPADLEKFNQLIADSGKKAQHVTDQLNVSIERQRVIVGQTTNEISRELAEIGKENKAKREAFEQDKSAVDIAESLLGTRQQNIQRLAALQAQLKEVKKAQKDLDDQEKSGTVTSEKAMSVRANLIAKQREYQAAIKDLNLVLNNQEKQMQASDGSYQKQSLQLEMLKKAYKGLTDEEKNGELGKRLGEEIGNLDAHLKDLAADMGEFQRNTGNYAIANQNVKTELRELVQELALLTIQYRNMSDEEKASAQGQELEKKMQEMTARASELKDAVADVNREIQSGANDTQTFSAISEGINMLISGVGGLTAASHALGIGEKDLVKIQTTLQASLAASNAITKAQTALQKESNLMVGVARLQQAAHATAIEIKTAAEGKGIIATKAATVAQAAFNAVAKANPYVLLATGIGLLVAAIWGFTKATKSETEEQKKAREEMEKSKKEYEDFINVEKRLAEAREKGIESCSDEIAKLHILYTAATDVTRSFDERRLAVKKLQELYPPYFKNLNAEVIMAGKAKEAYDSLSEAIIAKALIEAKQDLVKQYADKYVKSLADMGAATEKLTQAMHDLSHFETMNYSEGSERLRDFIKKDEEQRANHVRRVKSIEEQSIDDLNELHAEDYEKQRTTRHAQLEQAVSDAKAGVREASKIKDGLERAMLDVEKTIDIDKFLEVLGSSVTAKNPTKETKEETTKTYDEIKEAVLEYTQEIIAGKIAMTEKGSKEEYDLTLKYIENEQQLREIAIVKQYTKQKEEIEKSLANEQKVLDNSLKQKKISQEEYNAAVKKYTDQLATLEDERADQVDNAVRKSAKAKQDAQKEYTEAYISSLQETYAKEQEMREINLMQDVAALTKMRADQIISEEEYQQRLAELQQKYAEETADKQIEMLEKVLEAEELTDEQRAEIAKELAKIKTKAAKDSADAELKVTKKVEKEEEVAERMRERNVKKFLQEVSKMVSKVSKLVSTIYDNQIQKIEEEEDANEQAHDAEIERIEHLEETGAITKEEAEARKRAAEQRTAEKNEELEKKKQEIKHKQAVWDKAASISEAIIATSLGVAEALKLMWPMNLVIAALVGAMGAVEIATIAATPIPAYAKGTKDNEEHPGGLALVGDAGKKEAVVFDNRIWITPDKPTIVDMPKGAVVYPDADRLPAPVFVTVTPEKDAKPIVIVNHDSKKLERGLAQTNALLRQSILTQRRIAYNAAYDRYKATRL